MCGNNCIPTGDPCGTACTPAQYSYCNTKSDCEGATRYWCNNTYCESDAASCSTACTETNLSACNSSSTCTNVSGFWCESSVTSGSYTCEDDIANCSTACSSANPQQCTSSTTCNTASGRWCTSSSTCIEATGSCEALALNCDNGSSSVFAGDTITCDALCEGISESATWNWLSVSNCSTNSCTIPDNSEANSITVSVEPLADSLCGPNSLNITVEDQPVGTVTCGGTGREDQPFTCTAKCDDNMSANMTASWTVDGVSQSETGLTFSYTPADAGSYAVVADVTGCLPSSTSVTVEAKPTAAITCTEPIMFDETFTCSATCDELPTDVNWLAGYCNATNTENFSCSLIQNANIVIAETNDCYGTAFPVALEYRDLELSCNP